MALTRINNQALTNVTSAGLVNATGTVLQMKNANTTTTTTVSNTVNTWGDIAGMSITITPKSANSKMLIMYTNHIYLQAKAGQNWTAVGIRLLRGSTVIQTDGDSSYGNAHNSAQDYDRMMYYQNNQYVDTPNTTSAVTYHLEAAATWGVTDHQINNGSYGGGGEFTILEIAG